MWIKYEPSSFKPSLLDTSCGLLAKYEVIQAKTLLKANKKPKKSMVTYDTNAFSFELFGAPAH